ncbi:hypothetical protein Syun_027799 [Stephania yunnanensis]|uniref:Uncharacterized protein n=1 Tax=Stephania yunnanensis TaxID=152371 RepID=A0AAP0ENI3_9MAGN
MSVEAAKRLKAQVVIVTSNPEGSIDAVSACKAEGIAGHMWTQDDICLLFGLWYLLRCPIIRVYIHFPTTTRFPDYVYAALREFLYFSPASSDCIIRYQGPSD